MITFRCGRLTSTAGFILHAIYFFLTPVYVLSAAHMTGEPLLLFQLLALIAVLCIGDPSPYVRAFPCIARIAVIADLLRVHDRLTSFYALNKKRPLLFYVLYPFTCPIFFPFSLAVRQEARLYGGLLAGILFALACSAANAYRATFPPYLQPGDAIDVLVVRVGLACLVVVCTLLPTLTISLSYCAEKRMWRLRALAAIALASALSTSSLIQGQFSTINFISAQLLHYRFKASSAFRRDVRDVSEMFLEHASHKKSVTLQAESGVHTELTDSFRRVVGKVVVDEEMQALEVISFCPDEGQPQDRWLAIRINYHGISHPAHIIGAINCHNGGFCGSWNDLPIRVQRVFTLVEGGHEGAADGAWNAIGKKELIDDWKDLDLSGPMFFGRGRHGN